MGFQPNKFQKLWLNPARLLFLFFCFFFSSVVFLIFNFLHSHKLFSIILPVGAAWCYYLRLHSYFLLFFHMQTKHLQLISPLSSIKLSGKTNFLLSRRSRRHENDVTADDGDGDDLPLSSHLWLNKNVWQGVGGWGGKCWRNISGRRWRPRFQLATTSVQASR